MVVHACNPSYLGGWGRRITWTRALEVAVSQDHTTALQPSNRARFHPKKNNNNCWLDFSGSRKGRNYIPLHTYIIHTNIYSGSRKGRNYISLHMWSIPFSIMNYERYCTCDKNYITIVLCPQFSSRSIQVSQKFSSVPHGTVVFSSTYCFASCLMKLEDSARHGGSRLSSQHFGRPRRVDHEIKRSRPSWSTW